MGDKQPDSDSRSRRSKPVSSQVRPTQLPRILIVDDDPDILALLQISLQRAGYQIQTAERGAQALEMLDEFSPDVICVDYMMPEMNGQELAQHIRARRDLLYVPIVMLTAASTDSVNRLEMLESGVDAFLNKPSSREELQVTLRTMLRIKSGQDNMLAALERVAEVQDELMQYERQQQSQYDTLRSATTAFTHELSRPLEEAGIAAVKLGQLLEQPRIEALAEQMLNSQRAFLQEIKQSLTQADAVLQRLNETYEIATNNKSGNL